MKQGKITDPAPAFPSKNVPIALSCSEYYSLYAAVFLKSLAQHSTSEHGYDILIFTKDITEATMDMLCGIVADWKNISVRFLDVNRYLERYTLHTHAHFGIESYFRLLYPYILIQYRKILYFDCDLVLKTDAAELYREKIGNAFLGACLDAVVVGAINDPSDKTFGEYGWREYCRGKLGMEKPLQYLNSGVLIFNLARFRSEYPLEYVLDDIQKKNYYLLDQDALNALCAKSVVILNIAWNMTTDVAGKKLPYIDKAPKKVSRAYYAARKSPHTVHYADAMKPWKNPNEDMGCEFWEVARTLPVYTRILARMEREELERCTVYPTDPSPEMRPMGLRAEWRLKICSWKEKIRAWFRGPRQEVEK